MDSGLDYSTRGKTDDIRSICNTTLTNARHVQKSFQECNTRSLSDRSGLTDRPNSEAKSHGNKTKNDKSLRTTPMERSFMIIDKNSGTFLTELYDDFELGSTFVSKSDVKEFNENASNFSGNHDEATALDAHGGASQRFDAKKPSSLSSISNDDDSSYDGHPVVFGSQQAIVDLYQGTASKASDSKRSSNCYGSQIELAMQGFIQIPEHPNTQNPFVLEANVEELFPFFDDDTTSSTNNDSDTGLEFDVLDSETKVNSDSGRTRSWSNTPFSERPFDNEFDLNLPRTVKVTDIDSLFMEQNVRPEETEEEVVNMTSEEEKQNEIMEENEKTFVENHLFEINKMPRNKRALNVERMTLWSDGYVSVSNVEEVITPEEPPRERVNLNNLFLQDCANEDIIVPVINKKHELFLDFLVDETISPTQHEVDVESSYGWNVLAFDNDETGTYGSLDSDERTKTPDNRKVEGDPNESVTADYSSMTEYKESDDRSNDGLERDINTVRNSAAPDSMKVLSCFRGDSRDGNGTCDVNFNRHDCGGGIGGGINFGSGGCDKSGSVGACTSVVDDCRCSGVSGCVKCGGDGVDGCSTSVGGGDYKCSDSGEFSVSGVSGGCSGNVGNCSCVGGIKDGGNYSRNIAGSDYSYSGEDSVVAAGCSDNSSSVVFVGDCNDKIEHSGDGVHVVDGREEIEVECVLQDSDVELKASGGNEMSRVSDFSVSNARHRQSSNDNCEDIEVECVVQDDETTVYMDNGGNEIEVSCVQVDDKQTSNSGFSNSPNIAASTYSDGDIRTSNAYIHGQSDGNTGNKNFEYDDDRLSEGEDFGSVTVYPEIIVKSLQPTESTLSKRINQGGTPRTGVIDSNPGPSQNCYDGRSIENTTAVGSVNQSTEGNIGNGSGDSNSVMNRREKISAEDFDDNVMVRQKDVSNSKKYKGDVTNINVDVRNTGGYVTETSDDVTPDITVNSVKDDRERGFSLSDSTKHEIENVNKEDNCDERPAEGVKHHDRKNSDIIIVIDSPDQSDDTIIFNDNDGDNTIVVNDVFNVQQCNSKKSLTRSLSESARSEKITNIRRKSESDSDHLRMLKNATANNQLLKRHPNISRSAEDVKSTKSRPEQLSEKHRNELSLQERILNVDRSIDWVRSVIMEMRAQDLMLKIQFDGLRDEIRNLKHEFEHYGVNCEYYKEDELLKLENLSLDNDKEKTRINTNAKLRDDSGYHSDASSISDSKDDGKGKAANVTTAKYLYEPIPSFPKVQTLNGSKCVFEIVL